MSPNLIAHVCVSGVALLLDGVRINFKPGETLPDVLPLSTLDELVSLGAVEKRIAPVPDSSASEAAGNNEAGAAGGAIPGTHPHPESDGSGAAAEDAAAPATEAAAEPAAPTAGKKKAA